MKAFFTWWILGLCLFLSPWGAVAAERLELGLIIGNNIHTKNPQLRLKNADDDALMAAELFRFIHPRGRLWLLVEPDQDTLDRGVPGLELPRRPPTLGAWNEALTEIQRLVREARAVKRVQVQVLVYFAGHGEEEGAAHLADSMLSRQAFRAGLSSLEADEVIALLDGCYLANVVRGQSELEAPPPFFLIDPVTPSRPPWLGVLSTSTTAKEKRDGGLLSLISLSALRGPADLNGDQRVTFPEWAGYVDAVFASLGTTMRVTALPPLSNPRAVVAELSASEMGGIRLSSDFPSGHLRVKLCPIGDAVADRYRTGRLVADFYHRQGRQSILLLEPGEYRLERIDPPPREPTSFFIARVTHTAVGRGLVSFGRLTRMEPVALRDQSSRGIGDVPSWVIREELISAHEYESLATSPFRSGFAPSPVSRHGKPTGRAPAATASTDERASQVGLSLGFGSPTLGVRYSSSDWERWHMGGQVRGHWDRTVSRRGIWSLSLGFGLQYALEIIPELYVADGFRWTPAYRHEVRLLGAVRQTWEGRRVNVALETGIGYAPGCVSAGLGIATNPLASTEDQARIARDYVYPLNSVMELTLVMHFSLGKGWELGPTARAEVLSFQPLGPAGSGEIEALRGWYPQIVAGLELRQKR